MACEEVGYNKAIDGLNTLVKESPQLKAVAAQKIDEVIRELSLKANVEDEANGGADHHEIKPLDKIKEGFLKFKVHFKKEEELFKALAESQHPKFMIVACADSRVDPCRILGLELGDAFVIRNVANIVPYYSPQKESAAIGSAIEYAVLHLKVEHFFVIGHSRCGGIKALMGSKEDGSNRFSEFIEEWVESVRHAANKVSTANPEATFEEKCAICEKEAVNRSLANVITYPYVRDAVAEGKLSVHGGYYDFVKGSFQHWSLHLSLSQPHLID